MQDHRETRYQPVQRIGRACLECRKKKTRCTGEEPSCRKCRRLHKACVYEISSTHRKDSFRSDDTESLHTSVAILSAKISRIEQILEELRDHLKGNSQRQVQSPAAVFEDDMAVYGTSQTSHSQLSIHNRGSLDTTLPIDRSAQMSLADDETKWLTVNSSVVAEGLDTYFKFCHNQPYSIFHEAQLRKRFVQNLIPRYLIFAILASAARFSNNPFYGSRNYETSVFYARKSWSSIVATCFAADRAADLTIIQTVTLLSIFDFTGSYNVYLGSCVDLLTLLAGKTRHGAAWVKIGLAVRLAQDLKIMMEEPVSLPNEEREERRRVFWSIYLLDRLVTCGRARPPAIVDSSCVLQLPIDEVAWKNCENYSTPNLETFASRDIPNTSGTGPFALIVLMAHTLSKVSQYVLQTPTSRGRQRPWDVNSEQASIDADLLCLEGLQMHTWTTTQLMQRYQSADGQIDQHSAGAAVFSRTLFHLSHCLLNHPFLFRLRIRNLESTIAPSLLARTFDVGWNHAKCMIEHISQARHAGIIAHTSFYSYCAAVACSILGLYLHSVSDWRREPSANLLDQALSFVDDLSGYWPNAASCVSCFYPDSKFILIN